MIKKVECYKVCCDKCGKVLGWEPDIENFFYTIKEAKEGLDIALTSDTGWYEQKGKLVCENCLEIKED